MINLGKVLSTTIGGWMRSSLLLILVAALAATIGITWWLLF